MAGTVRDQCLRPIWAGNEVGTTFPRSRLLGNGAYARDVFGRCVIHPPPGCTRFVAVGGHRLSIGPVEGLPNAVGRTPFSPSAALPRWSSDHSDDGRAPRR
jgi:hypothetical protein